MFSRPRLLPATAQSVSHCCHWSARSVQLRPAASRWFHASTRRPSPILPLPAIIASIFKSGKLVSLVSLSSKTSLTLLPHTFKRDKGKTVGKILIGIPMVGMGLLVAVGLDQAPNTSRLRFVYLSEEEEKQEVDTAVSDLLRSQAALLVDPDHGCVLWLKSIIDNLAKVVQDDIRSPVRAYEDPVRDYKVHVVADGNTLNALCAGQNIIVYDLMLQAMDYDTDRMAVILSHEMAHHVQRHFVETHGFVSLLLMLGDITRGVFWVVTESLGPYVNQKINDAIRQFVDLKSETTYNRQLEREADLVGLKFLAKAGYDPRVALDVWNRMALLDEEIKALEERQLLEQQAAATDDPATSASLASPSVGDMLDSFLSMWFGSTHPPSAERLTYMQEHMDEAVALYEETIKINGLPQHYDLFQDPPRTSPKAWMLDAITWLWPGSK
ncbi:hypothetical protein DM01DRAFT_1333423 [Hesseltinella vesiculosa]|uniref:Peptidase M48 domain-containing protein n=1 Tax=Hesseltinella vesiculosa TaxID=101127 RepID=A0A1X2GPP9_9FUNG|nr:hypothetical protein DM01DRAFT_1333423 [Hesseltinella vesiculosa]